MSYETVNIHILPDRPPATAIQQDGERLVIMYPNENAGGNFRIAITFYTKEQLQEFIWSIVGKVNLDDYIVERAEELGLINPEDTPV